MRLTALLAGVATVAVAWRGDAPPVGRGEIAVTPLTGDRPDDAQATVLAVARAFYRSHDDDYDELVIWPDPSAQMGLEFYLPVRADGWGGGSTEPVGNIGTRRLYGIVFMGSGWRAAAHATAGAEGPGSVLWVLAHESEHRRAAYGAYLDDRGERRDDLFDRQGKHWSYWAATGGAPLGGQAWTPSATQPDFWEASTPRDVRYGDLDLYAMGLLPAEKVKPITLLRPTPGSLHTDAEGRLTVAASSTTIPLERIVAASGVRRACSPTLKQAWTYAPIGTPSPSTLSELDDLRRRWTDVYASATRGLGRVDTTLR